MLNLFGMEKLKITLAALINSSAKHSAIDLMLRNAASRAPVQSNQIAYERKKHTHVNDGSAPNNDKQIMDWALNVLTMFIGIQWLQILHVFNLNANNKYVRHNIVAKC